MVILGNLYRFMSKFLLKTKLNSLKTDFTPILIWPKGLGDEQNSWPHSRQIRLEDFQKDTNSPVSLYS